MCKGNGWGGVCQGEKRGVGANCGEQHAGRNYLLAAAVHPPHRHFCHAQTAREKEKSMDGWREVMEGWNAKRKGKREPGGATT